jgi:Reverse transcriptase (RNA-dependent DNA polymerase)
LYYFAIIAGDELTSLKEAKNSLECLKWEKTMQEQLNLLKEIGTWEMVQKPSEAVPIANKWVFIKKWNKEGDVVRYTLQLVVKGCEQCPGFDFTESFSPVVHMDTLRAILALVPMKGLMIQQMGVKGIYLNSTLQGTIYMWQPEGCEDASEQICRLINPLYGLKQAGCEWNNDLDEKLKKQLCMIIFRSMHLYLMRW